jgi:hypothetical protein
MASSFRRLQAYSHLLEKVSTWLKPKSEAKTGEALLFVHILYVLIEISPFLIRLSGQTDANKPCLRAQLPSNFPVRL